MADPTIVVAALVRELIAAGVIEVTGQPVEVSDTVGVHLSWAQEELQPALVKTWRDPESGRVHCQVRWKPSDT